MACVIIFFVFKQKTAYEMRISDWSSDVCSSDLDMDSSVSPTHGDQEGTAWNGHFDCTCYHPIFLFNQFGMLERCALRNGNVHSADGWRDVLDPVIARYAGRDLGGRFFRADAAYAIPAIYLRLEEARFFYAIRLPANA